MVGCEGDNIDQCFEKELVEKQEVSTTAEGVRVQYDYRTIFVVVVSKSLKPQQPLYTNVRCTPFKFVVQPSFGLKFKDTISKQFLDPVKNKFIYFHYA